MVCQLRPAQQHWHEALLYQWPRQQAMHCRGNDEHTFEGAYRAACRWVENVFDNIIFSNLFALRHLPNCLKGGKEGKHCMLHMCKTDQLLVGPCFLCAAALETACALHPTNSWAQLVARQSVALMRAGQRV
jgi:hypothetical protein